MTRVITLIEMIAGYAIGFLALITFSEAILRYGLSAHIPDGFVLGQMMQGIAICWGIATATYADRHITVDILYTFGSDAMRRVFDVVGYRTPISATIRRWSSLPIRYRTARRTRSGRSPMACWTRSWRQ